MKDKTKNTPQVLLRRALLVLLDAAIVAFSFYFALLLRADGAVDAVWWPHNRALLYENLPWIVAVYIVCFLAGGLYSVLWKYAGERDLLRPATAMQPPGRSIRFDDPRSAAAEQGIIKLLYLDPGLFRDRTNVPDAAQFSSPELRHIYTVLLAHGGTGTVQIAALSGELSPDELALLTGIIQQPAELANGARALDDYISILQTQATAGAASSEADLLAFAKQLKEHKGYGGKDGTERT